MAWLIVAMIITSVACLALNRVHAQQLFLIRLPFDRDPLAAELHDAAHTAQRWKAPALIFLAVTAAAIGARSPSGPARAMHTLRSNLRTLLCAHPRLCGLFLAACIADFFSTTYYFHVLRVDDEFHPGIKLFTYAFGLSVGCLLGKLVHALLGLIMSALFSKITRPMLIVLLLAYSAATVWNFRLALATS